MTAEGKKIDLGELERVLAQSSPAGLATVISNGRWQFASHLEVINNVILQIVRGEVTRAMFFMPPRHGKSEFLSMYTPAWYIGMNPDNRVILVSYESDFAAQWGRRSRSILSAYGESVFPTPVKVDPESAAASRWDIHKRRGGMQTAGIGGPITGKGGNLIIIDDPLKNDEEALSTTIRQRHKDWYKSTLYSRLEPGGAILLIMTRWHQDDLAGWLLSEAESGGEKWVVVSFPAIAEETDVLGRAPGDALWPFRFDETAMARIKKASGPYWWAAMYQQRPAPLEGGMFQRQWFEIVPRAPTDLYRLTYWDLAASEGRGDYTVGLTMGEKSGFFYVTNVVRVRKGPADVETLVKQRAADEGGESAIEMEQEPGSSGLTTTDHYARHVLKGYIFRGVRSTGSKVERARAVSAAAQGGYIKLVRAIWNSDFLDEVTFFPNGTHDDQVDTLSGAYNGLTLGAFRIRGDTTIPLSDAVGERYNGPEWQGDIPTL
jgi:predicted phage terminase large subunit-like protein